MGLERLQILMTGQVQGVGFRPHAYRIAHQLDLTGWVQNTASGVLIEIQGQTASQFLSKFIADLPILAKIANAQAKSIPLEKKENKFQIIESEAGPVCTSISPDSNICSACLRELFEQNSRYYLYPFLNCTHCGPRLTITHNLPYDRGKTAMAMFPFCDTCQQEYVDPNNRRYHAQSTACVNCGPQLTLPITQIGELILDGKIIALKGLGSYQLICDAKNKNAVQQLRARKNREAKPFALMVLNAQSADAIAELSPSQESLLLSKERPIVLLPKRANLPISEEVAPGLSHFGVMLPYTPLHYTLFHALAGKPEGHKWLDEYNPTILVVTSANLGGASLIIDDKVAQKELSKIADKIISYNREIVCRVDDSVMRIMNDAPFFIRRARGFVPDSIKLPHSIPSTLAVGGHLKNTFCLTREDEAFVSQHLGSLNNNDTIDFFHESLNCFMALLDIKPERIAHDSHPDFYTTQFAQNYGIPVCAVQHHHAHLAAVAAEHHIQEPALGLALDGYGYGTNGESWGGELLLLENTSFQRLGRFYPLPQPGGDIAVREPWRMAAGIMFILGQGNEITRRFQNYPHASLISDIIEKQINTPLTSSCGRLFDAASGILGVNRISEYEGQAAMQLESLVTQPEVLPNGWQIEGEYLNMLPTLIKLFDMDPIKGANLFHGTLIAGITKWILKTAEKTSINTVLLGGGCFSNRVLTEGIMHHLSSQGLRPFLSQRLPSNDGGISLGQAWIAGRI